MEKTYIFMVRVTMRLLEKQILFSRRINVSDLIAQTGKHLNRSYFRNNVCPIVECHV